MNTLSCRIAGVLSAMLLTTALWGAQPVAKGLLEGPFQLVKQDGAVRQITLGGVRCIELSGTVPEKVTRNHYTSASVKFPKPIDLTGRSLIFKAWSPAPSPGFYVRCYNRDAKKPCWSFQSWDSLVTADPTDFRLTAGRSSVMKWEAEVAFGAANEVDRIEFIIGSSNAGSPQKLLVSSLEVVPMLSEAEEMRLSPNAPPVLDTPVELPTATALVKDGKAAFVLLHPATPAGKSAANQIAGKVRQLTGAAVECRPGTLEMAQPAIHTVMLGNLLNNPAMQILYARRQTMADGYYPGPGGHTVETIVEPFRRGADVIVLGASDDDGLAAAAEAFNKLLTANSKGRDLSLPVVFETDYRNPPRIKKPEGEWEAHRKAGIAEAQRRLSTGQHTSLGGYLNEIGTRYLIHRSPLDAKLYVEVAKLYAESAKADPRKFGGAWGFDSDFPSYQALAGWDLIEHDAALTAEDRLATSNALLRWLHEAIYDEAKGGLLIKAGPVSNHLTFCSLGSLMGGLYFDKYYGQELPQPQRWLKTVRHNFALQNTIAKCYDDSEGYMWLTWNHVITYSLAYPDYTFFKSGTAAKVMRYCALTMDNLGAQSAYGDSSGWNPTSHHIVLEKYYAATRDPLVGYMLSRKRTDRAYCAEYYAPLPALPTPTTLDGIQFYPLELGFYRKTVDSVAKTVPPGLFDKLSIREKMDPDALYLMVDGINNGGHRHADGNSILRFTQFGRVWLGDNDYKKNQQKYHNSLLMLCDGESFPLPDLMRIQKLQDTPEWGAVTIIADNVGPAVWRRHYVWLKADQAWMLIDEFVPTRAGDFRLIQRWNALGDVAARPDGYELSQKDGALMRVQTTGDLPLSVTDNEDLGRSWQKYPFADPVVRVIDQTLERHLEPGAPVRIAAVWHGAPKGQAVPEWALDRQPGGFAVNTGRHQYTIRFDAACNPLVKVTNGRGVTPRKAAVTAENEAAAPPAAVTWQQTLLADKQVESLTRMIPLAGKPYLAVGAAVGKAGRVTLLDAATGKTVSSFAVAGPVNDLAAVEIDGAESLVLACRDGVLRAVTLEGKPLWEVKMEFYRLFPDLWKVRLADIDGDGRPEIIAGCDNWRTYAFGRDGKELWRFEVIHPVRALEIADIDGNGKPDILVGTGYMWATVLNEKGEKRWGGRFGFGCRAINAVLNGKKGARNVVVGIDSGLLTFHDVNGRKLGEFLTGDEIFMIEPAAAENGREDALVASYNGFIYRFGPEGRRIWSRALSAPALVIRALPDGGCVAGAEDGTVYRFDKAGKCLSVNAFDGKIADLLVQPGAVRVVTDRGVAASIAR